MSQKEKQHTSVWHALSGNEVLSKLHTSSNGLHLHDIATLQSKYGLNKLPGKTQEKWYIIFLRQFKDPLIYILIAAGLISVFVGELLDASFIGFVITVNALLGFYQEWKAEKNALELENLIRINCRVYRDGVLTELDSEELVPGDIVVLEGGMKIPADMRLISARSFAVDESLLTGEALPIEKSIDTISEQTEAFERSNIIYAGSTATAGRATGVVIATGLNTEVGKIAGSVATTQTAKPALVVRMDEFSKKIGLYVIIASVFIIIIGFLQGTPIKDIFFVAIALAVAAIPEALPIVITVALSLGVTQMAMRHVIVRNLTAVETLGSCTYIASDKTGTLTVNQQTLKTILLPDMSVIHVTGEGYNGEGTIENENNDKKYHTHLSTLATVSSLTNEGTLTHQDGKWVHSGDAMDIGFLAFAWKMGMDPGTLRNSVTVVAETHYAPEIRFSALYYTKPDSDIIHVAVKGAVEVLLEKYESCACINASESFDYHEIHAQAEELAEKGYRVICVAQGQLPALTPLPEEPTFEQLPSLELLGLAGFIDPLRPDAYEAVTTCQEAGIVVSMVTGDHPKTALTIAKELGIAKDEKDVVTGSSLEALGDEDDLAFCEVVWKTRVFARISPLLKRSIVAALQKNGEYVAVTGDGVNDTPALRKAHIGVAMGSGTDLAKDTAAMIVTDDKFSSIVSGIALGRMTYDNIRKVISILTSTCIAEVTMVILALLFALPVPLTALQLLWLNLATNGIQNIALAFEPEEPGVMKRKPRKPTEPIFNTLMIQELALGAGYMAIIGFLVWYILLHLGWEVSAARNMVLLAMVLMINAHCLNSRSEHLSIFSLSPLKNLPLMGAIIGTQLLQITILYIPLTQQILEVQPVTLYNWVILFILALGIIVVMEIFKFIVRRKNAKMEIELKTA
ncbi:MAG: HAD-IC family P-type ATPase [Methanomicrobiales archaeon]|jgi:calcium-translocating P-type ATPase|nr:HAD-IC family P-type ATPase [Methanomicrobiales archaeon]